MDRALAGWVLQKQNQKASLTGNLIKEEAKSFAGRMTLENPPKLSNSWLLSFQLRHAFRNFVVHGESGNAQMVPTADLDDIRWKVLQYLMERVYNFDESSLFCRMASDRSIATRQIVSAKKDKTRMTVDLMVYMICLDRDRIFIGHAEKPRCFKKNSAEELGFFYKSNKSASMTALFFHDVVEHLNDRVKHKVIFIVDSPSCHSIED